LMEMLWKQIVRDSSHLLKTDGGEQTSGGIICNFGVLWINNLNDHYYENGGKNERTN